MAATAAKVAVTTVTDPRPAIEMPGRAVIILEDGSVVPGTVTGSRGTAALPMDDAAVRAKFLANTGGGSDAEALAHTVFRLSEIESVTAVLELAAAQLADH